MVERKQARRRFMSDGFATAQTPGNHNAGVAAMSRLADRLVALQPPLAAESLTRPTPQSSPAVKAGLARAAAISARAARVSARPSRTLIGAAVDSFVAACAFIPYALVALGLRFVMARVFFLDGQSRIEGPSLPLNLHDSDLSVLLPMQVKADTITAFLTQYAPLPVPPVLAAYLLSYAEFILPIMLLFGFGTRIAALGMLIITAVIQIYVMPGALWTVHVYWAAILMVLIAQGPGQISVDHVIRHVTRR
jgi:putative oxidoreductase